MISRTFAGGKKHCVFLTHGGVFVSGDNTYGQLGLAEFPPSVNLVRKVTFLDRFPIISVGCCQYTTAFLTESGDVYTTGSGIRGELGVGTGSLISPGRVAFPFPRYETKIKGIACGGHFMMALSISGVLFGWGENDVYQLGIENNISPQTTPVRVMIDRSIEIISVACGKNHTLALTHDGKVLSWGSNVYGQLGHGEMGRKRVEYVNGLMRYKCTQIACGNNHSMALVKKKGSSDICFTWGNGENGQLGHSNFFSQYKPKADYSIVSYFKREKITWIDCGAEHSMKMTRKGKAYTWGKNDSRELFQFTRSPRVGRASEIPIPNEEKFVHGQCWLNGTSFITKNGDLFISGKNCYGDMGIGSENTYQECVRVPLSYPMVIPREIHLEMALEDCARFVLFILLPDIRRVYGIQRKRKRREISKK